MKSVITLFAGALLKTTAAPLVVTGMVTQATARGILKTGSALNSLGESAELAGHRYHTDGAARIEFARADLSRSRAERKAERAEAKAKAAAEARVARAQRIQQLEVARTMRRQMAEMDLESISQMARQMSSALEVEVVR